MAWLPLLLTLLPLAAADEGDADTTEAEPPIPVEPAEPEPEPSPIVIDLDVAFPSALERLEPSAEAIAREGTPELEAITAELPELAGLIDGGGLLRGRFGLRPRLAWVGRLTEPGGGMRAGLTLRHQWWSLLPLGPQWVGESALRGSLGFAGARGAEASLQSVAGAWAGPISIAVGPRLAWDGAEFSSGAPLEPVLGAGPLAMLGTELGPVGLQLGGGPAWLLAGEREAAGLPVGHEWYGLAAVGVDTGLLRWTVNGQVRETSAGTITELSLGLNLALD